MKIARLMELAEKWYPKKKYYHALRVAGFAVAMSQYDSRVDQKDAFIVGLAHDLIEDTDCSYDELVEIIGVDLFSSVSILTKDDNEEYEDYIRDILASNDPLAILVKRADMKDHLTQTETLTDKLKEKYFPVMGLLL